MLHEFTPLLEKAKQHSAIRSCAFKKALAAGCSPTLRGNSCSAVRENAKAARVQLPGTTVGAPANAKRPRLNLGNDWSLILPFAGRGGAGEGQQNGAPQRSRGSGGPRPGTPRQKQRAFFLHIFFFHPPVECGSGAIFVPGLAAIEMVQTIEGRSVFSVFAFWGGGLRAGRKKKS
ncbi:hypothetical protein TraAM80_10161 [Trypanosoma rangeli]|uniref:Uncharacterized protein n=1 Tax=Trypanosoma rangeli TaxID=5698 RepID=A0A422MQY9_TRYRA|nr:uncharacterized protein TraAM80_10161 [Trypanosoma rangeli]RNE95610.1 hypothetical protein TraAM80_10161 [Trypanosoma rangeli]|eukprot:RNE95610.1 hypothetical protein TraAM80_10161 [Trypanosoma rangeli]